MPPITNDWADYLKEEYKKPYYRKLYQKVMDEYHTKLIFPPADDIFNAFHFTPVKDVKVVILGQDPYHGDGGTSCEFPQRYWMGRIYGCCDQSIESAGQTNCIHALGAPGTE